MYSGRLELKVGLGFQRLRPPGGLIMRRWMRKSYKGVKSQTDAQKPDLLRSFLLQRLILFFNYSFKIIYRFNLNLQCVPLLYSFYA